MMTDTERLSDLIADALRAARNASSSAQDAASEAQDASSYADSARESAESAESYADEAQEAIEEIVDLVTEVIAENQRLTEIINRVRAALDGGTDQAVVDAVESATATA